MDEVLQLLVVERGDAGEDCFQVQAVGCREVLAQLLSDKGSAVYYAGGRGLI
ncbi:hypothetical protein ACH47C_26955 [Streptomyces rishiriensis]|uniref:hypothetical protein n=1 Tax=Streptomyces rishiriensis TaxID=68264 RepID=UPI0033C326AB